MLGMFTPKNAGSDRSTADSSTLSDSDVLTQLEAMRKVQTQQAAIMTSLEGRISEMLGQSKDSHLASTSESLKHAVGSCHLNSIAARRSHTANDKQAHSGTWRELRKASWAWDPQVQADLELSFKTMRSGKQSMQTKSRVRAERICSVFGRSLSPSSCIARAPLGNGTTSTASSCIESGSSSVSASAGKYELSLTVRLCSVVHQSLLASQRPRGAWLHIGKALNNKGSQPAAQFESLFKTVFMAATK